MSRYQGAGAGLECGLHGLNPELILPTWFLPGSFLPPDALLLPKPMTLGECLTVTHLKKYILIVGVGANLSSWHHCLTWINDLPLVVILGHFKHHPVGKNFCCCSGSFSLGIKYYFHPNRRELVLFIATSALESFIISTYILKLEINEADSSICVVGIWGVAWSGGS